MVKIFVRIASVDMDGYCGREFHPHPDMKGKFVRVTEMETVHDEDNELLLQLFTGMVVDNEGNDLPNGLVQLVDHELETVDAISDIPVLYSLCQGYKPKRMIRPDHCRCL